MSNGWDKLPVALEGGELFTLLTPKGREDFAVTILKESGDWERLVHILQNDKEKFFEWAKEVVLKRLPKPAQEIQHGVSENVEALWERLDRAEKATLIEATAEVVDAEQDA